MIAINQSSHWNAPDRRLPLQAVVVWQMPARNLVARLEGSWHRYLGSAIPYGALESISCELDGTNSRIRATETGLCVGVSREL